VPSRQGPPRICAPSFINDLTKARCAELARAPGLPRLSLCVSGEDEWLLTGATARKVAKGVRLLDRGLYD